MRSAAALVLGLAISTIAGPLFAVTNANRGECVRMTNQIARYERDAKWADQRGNQLWEQASKNRVAQMTERRDSLCPQYKKPNPLAVAAAKAADLIWAAAKAAAPYFLPGLF